MKHYVRLAARNQEIPIHLVGAGGTGSVLAVRLCKLNLALKALGHPGIDVTIFDPDTVSEANVGRTLYFEPDVGHPKASILATRINQSTGFSWRAVPTEYDPGEQQAAPILITAVDTGRAREEIGRAIKNNDDATYWVDCGNSQYHGQVVIGTVHPVPQPEREDVIDRLPTVLDFYPDIADPEKEKDQGPSCSLEAALSQQDLFINEHVALEASQILWRLFQKGCLEYSAVYVSLTPRNTRTLPIDPKAWERFGYRMDSKCLHAC
ncbi:MAG: PRTRC system ThiF family protein [Candidatus Manganitrophus sp. SA1]|nr:PRTRC system ThiF family protein [Candidatus Manganitrophus morganii]